VPLVLLKLLVPAGAENDPAGAPGLAALTAALLDEGTRSRSSREIAAMAENLGGYVSSSADWDVAEIETLVPRAHLRTGLALLAEIATTPTFPEEEFQRLRSQTIVHLRRRRAQPAVLASDHLAAAIYSNSVYAHPLLGTEESLAHLSRSKITEFYERRRTPRGSALVAVGDFELRNLASMVEELFGDWQGGEARHPPVESSSAVSSPPIRLVDRPDAVQVELRLGHSGLKRSHPDFTTATVVSTLLGGKFMSRLNLSLRERHGMTYGAHSYFSKRRGPGPFLVSTAVATDATPRAIQETLFELHRIRNQTVEAEELEDTVNYLLGTFPYTTEGIGGLASRLRDLAVYELPIDYYERLGAALRALRPEEIRRCAEIHIRPEEVSIVVVGPADRLGPVLEEIAPTKPGAALE
jgi:zinc protease